MNRLLRILVWLALAAVATTASAQNYPNRTVTVVVPFPAGGAVDGVARILVQKLNEVPAGGSSTCHVNISNNGKFAVIANYGSGSCAAFAIGADGKLGARTGYQQHAGSSVDASRQKGGQRKSHRLV